MKSIKKTKTTTVLKATTRKSKAASPAVEPCSTLQAPSHIGQVSFEFVHPAAKSVCVAGSFNDWKPETAPLTPAGNGRWIAGLQVHPGRHEYLFVVDGQWVADPNAKETVTNPFGGQNSILTVAS